LAVALLPLLACSFEEAAPGVRGQCAAAVGEPVCAEEAIENGEDACWKLVECGSIPVSSPEDEDFFDQPTCERYFEILSEHRYNLALACVAASTCDQLRFPDGQDTPSTNPERMPACLEYGDQ
jgi:hypothetical protein